MRNPSLKGMNEPPEEPSVTMSLDTALLSPREGEANPPPLLPARATTDASAKLKAAVGVPEVGLDATCEEREATVLPHSEALV